MSIHSGSSSWANCCHRPPERGPRRSRKDPRHACRTDLDRGLPQDRRAAGHATAAAAALLKAQQTPAPAAGMSDEVAAIKQAVQSGAYQVDPQALAVKLLPHL